MTFHYVKIYLRSLKKRFILSLSLLTMLSLSVAGSFICFIIVMYESDYESFNNDKNSVYRIERVERKTDGPIIGSDALTPPVVASVFKEFPGVAITGRMFVRQGVVKVADKKFNEFNIYNADHEILDLLSIKMASGKKDAALVDAYTAVISETFAKKYFGKTDVLNEKIQLNEEEYLITGVFEDYPGNSHLDIDILFSYSTFSSDAKFSSAWRWNKVYTYVKVEERSSQDRIQNAADAYFREKQSELTTDESVSVQFSLDPISEIHLSSGISNEYQNKKNDITNLHFLSITSASLMLISFLNYGNMLVVLNASRKAEFGVRKAFGASRSDVIKQVLTDSISAFVFSAFCSIVVIVIFINTVSPYFNVNISKDFFFSTKYMFWFYACYLIGFTIMVFGNIYTCIRRIRPSTSNLNVKMQGLSFRKVLLVIQLFLAFTISNFSIALIKEYHLLSTGNTLPNLKQTLIIQAPNLTDSLYYSKIEAFKNHIASYSKVNHFTISSSVPGEKIPDFYENVLKTNRNSETIADKVYRIYIDENFFECFGIRLLEGKNFSNNASRVGNVILNETAVARLGFTSARDALGGNVYHDQDNYTIIGVCEDYNHESMKAPVEPTIFAFNDESWGYFCFTGALDESSLNSIKKHWNELVPDSPFEYTFLDDFWSKNYVPERIVSQSFSFFSILAIVMILFGVFALITLTISNRLKSIALRKVWGASFIDLVTKASVEFLLLILLAAMISQPISWYLINDWLSNYSTRIEMPWSMFALPILFLIVFTSIAIWQQLAIRLKNILAIIKHE